MNYKIKAELNEIQGVLWIIAGLLTTVKVTAIIFFIIGIAAIFHSCMLHYLDRQKDKNHVI